ncbi:pyruvate kinase [Ferrovibrio terrae]|uniref:Pyruvate kinase n=1 Tax=Ferrovibrio terrae TaxID=2594003 RepID=A0A516H7W4_9PROT|nr:pyruvate kinase [Ferrovibrio terrae]QDO99867.1 pyruvate kinase [Ferrovibrio terrae]
MHRERNVKIVATLGPASSTPDRIRALVEAGADVFRLNFSHGSHDDHLVRIHAVRALEQETGRPIGLLADLQGPKLRIGAFRDGAVDLLPGQNFRLDIEGTPGDATGVTLPHAEVLASLKPDTDLLLDDGKIRLRVKDVHSGWAMTEVMVGGRLSDRKGVNLPDTVVPLSALTPKDRADLAFALAHGVDWVALSFVQRPDDLREARELIQGRAALLAKIEKPSAVDCLDEIVLLCDALMVARGDLGVEMPLQAVPGLQKRIVRTARRAGKPVVVATQMLESMIKAPVPTRAEVSDVATAVYDGADAIMLSAESASGDYPVESVRTMDQIARQVERDPLYRGIMDAEHNNPESTASDAITAAARQVAETINAAAIVTYTMSGSTALRAARERPRSPILCLTPLVDTARRLTLAWGVNTVVAPDAINFADMIAKATALARASGLAKPGDNLVVTAGVPFGSPGNTNVLRIARVDAV